MATQWPLVIFTFFVCLTSGLLGGLGILVLRGRGQRAYLPGIITALASLVVGGLGAFAHLKHWERIFNGFGHITSGITQELIGVVVLGVICILWIVALRGRKHAVSRGLAVVTIVAAFGMVCATAHAYLMGGRPAWGLGLVAFYLANACLLGGVATWALAEGTGAEDAREAGAKLTWIGAALQLAGDLAYLATAGSARVADFGHYADPTTMTTHPVHVDSLLQFAVAGEGAACFWLSLVCAAIVLACGLVAARKGDGASGKTLMVVAVIAAVATSILFRVLIYQLGFSLTMLY